MGEALSPIQLPDSKLARKQVSRTEAHGSAASLHSGSERDFSWSTSHSQHEGGDFLSPDIHRLLTFVPVTLYFPHQGLRFQLLISLHHHVIMDGDKG